MPIRSTRNPFIFSIPMRSSRTYMIYKGFFIISTIICLFLLSLFSFAIYINKNLDESQIQIKYPSMIKISKFVDTVGGKIFFTFLCAISLIVFINCYKNRNIDI